MQEEQENEQIHCGLVMPISAIDGYTADHWEEVRDIIKEALPDSKYKVDLVSNADDVGIIQNRIVTNLYKADIIICDVSAKNPNVLFELGMRLAFDKPTVIIKDDLTNYIFDTSPIEHLTYPRDLHYASIKNFKINLKDKIDATLKAANAGSYKSFLSHFGDIQAAKVDTIELPQAEFIIKYIQNLDEKINKITIPNRVDKPLSKDESMKLIRESIKAFGRQQKIADEYLEDHKDSVKNFTFEYLSKIHSLSKDRIQFILNLFFDDVLFEFSIPF